jgi:type VI secretion system protein ImpI
MPEQQRASRAGDFLSSAADLPPPPPAMAPMAPMSPVADLWAATGLHRHEAAAAPPPPPPPPVEWPAPPEAPRQAGYSMASVAREVPFAAARPQPATPRPAPEPERPAAPAPALPSLDQLRAQVEAEILRQFAAGAGIPEAVLSGRRAPELAQELGSAMRLIVGQLMRLLKVRAEAKGMVRAAERTMIQARDNNALKFTPTPEAALAIVFGPAASGYLDLRQTFERSFADVMAHEEATFAAMQQAVGDLLTDLSPESVERAAANVKLGFLGNAKAHNWETFLERWQAKAGTGDNGMLDSFLELFAEHYDQLSRRRRQ